MNVILGLCHSYSGKVVTFQESVFASKRKLSKKSRFLRQAATGNCPRYVDDTFTKIHEYYVEEFTRHINSIDPNIIFTTEPESNGVLPFLDTCAHINDDGSTHVTVYRKPTHTDQYLNFKSNHHIEDKRSVVRTLLQRAEVLVTKPEDKSREVEHVKRALRTNQYEEWVFETPRAKPRDKSIPNRARTSIGLPYIHGTSEKLARIFRAHDVGVYHRPINTIRSLLVHPKDKTPDLQKCGVVYQITCPQYPHLYVVATRMKDHTSHNTKPTAVGDHCREHGHVISKNNVEVLAREEGWFKRKVCEAIEIKTLPYRQPSTETRDSTCSRSTAKFYLSVSHVIAVVRRAVTQPRRSGQLSVAA